ncbi:LacI family DNA-binding transcriptional regulator [Nakamurella flavida]|uniref:LacI family DNA-binding transcriptional regulator n=1 Tax=Nakamurella flavida TaxID=363630 RepID=A0A938YLE2_9ACTN|nr:LacI family DNA-binding transcriptional regulator [Nakamurella flavida]MBM9476838.1 LacI family DNA-binding transcriptional regulator [Nakamurella flavida]MDP9778720.1 LacI family transcriptional regulator [Nakamurella flavida]
MAPATGKRPTTLTDVARLAGVSIATASKALNGRNQVRASTRERVMVAAEQLSFSPNALARGLLAGRTGTVGLLTSDMEGRFSLPILMGAEDAFGRGSVSVFLCDARGDSFREQYHVKALLGRRVDGLIVVGSRTDARPPLPGRLSVPVVYAYSPSLDDQDTSVISDNVEAGRTAVDHLLALGRSRIVHISGDRTYAAARDRAEGATAALRAARLTPVGKKVHFGSWSESWGRSAIASLLAAHPDIDGVFAGSDQIARGVLEVLREKGRAVPEDVAVVGFDNWAVLATQARPQLTSMDMQLEQLGRRAAELLFSAMEGGTHPGIEKIGCSLVIRESTAG